MTNQKKEWLICKAQAKREGKICKPLNQHPLKLDIILIQSTKFQVEYKEKYL